MKHELVISFNVRRILRGLSLSLLLVIGAVAPTPAVADPGDSVYVDISRDAQFRALIRGLRNIRKQKQSVGPVCCECVFEFPNYTLYDYLVAEESCSQFGVGWPARPDSGGPGEGYCTVISEDNCLH